MIYLDYSATTPMSDSALEVYTKVAKQYFGNASSLHDYGSSASQVYRGSAKTIAKTINARPKDIHFTSGASESNFLAVYSLLEAAGDKGRHLITTKIEHSSVRNIFEKLEREGYEVTWIPVDEYGKLNLDNLEDAIRKDTVLASIIHVNSEIGTIQDMEAIGGLLYDKDVLFHSDCVQGFGKLKYDVGKLKIDAISVSGHKIYGPKGVGAVWINPKREWKQVIPSSFDNKFRPGTTDVPSIAAFATAAKEIYKEREEEQRRILSLRENLINGLKELEFEFSVEGHPEDVVPNIVGLRFPGMEGQFLMLECNQAGLAISTGSACQVGSEKPNTTMTALGKNEQEAREFVRLSLGKHTKLDEIPEIIEKMNGILSRHFNKVNRKHSKEEITS